MSNDIIPTNIQVPAHLAGRVGVPSTLGESMGGGISSGIEFPRISIKGSRFRIVDGGVESILDATELAVVIVGANPNLTKSWYATAWNPDAEPTQPDCFTLNGVTPDPTSTSPQNDLCASCPQNAWGSRITQQGTKVKACADQKRLAVVAADDPTGAIYLIQVTPAALKGLNKYHKELQMRGIPAEIVRTIISFDTSASFPKLQFRFGDFNNTETQAAVDPLFGSDKVKEITGEAQSPAHALVPAGDAAPVVAPAGTELPPAASTDQVPPGGFPATPVEVASTPAPEPVAEKKATGFGAATTVNAPPAPAEVEAATPAEEPAAAPVAPADATTDGLAAEITALMEEVADDA